MQDRRADVLADRVHAVVVALRAAPRRTRWSRRPRPARRGRPTSSSAGLDQGRVVQGHFVVVDAGAHRGVESAAGPRRRAAARRRCRRAPGPTPAPSSRRSSGDRSRPSLSTARLITCQCTSRSRTFSTSSTQRLVIQAQGHSGSNQKSRVVAATAGSCPRNHAVQPPCAGWQDAGVKTDATAASNLTRDEARERAALLTVAGYDLHARRHRRRRHPASGRSGRRRRSASAAPEPGAAHVRRPDRAARCTRPRSTAAPVDLDGFAGERLRADRAWPPRTSSSSTPTAAYMRTGEGLHRFVDPVDDAVYLYSQFETGRRQADVRLLRPARPQGDVHGARRPRPPTGRSSSSGGAASSAADGPGRASWRTSHRPRISTYLIALVAGPYHEVPDTHDGIPLGLYCRASLAEHLDAGRAVRGHQAGLRLLPPGLRLPLPVRQVRPALRARSSTPGRWRTPAA